MKAAIIASASAIVVSAAITPMARSLAHRFGALDRSLSSRKIHIRPIPRVGGIAIVLAFFAPLVGLIFVDSEVGRSFYASSRAVFGLFGGGLAIAALGVYDDLKGANAKVKFLVQFGVAFLMYWAGFCIDRIALPFGPEIELGLLALPFTMLWITGVINAVNLIDGLDGLAGGIAFIAVTTICIIAVLRGDALMTLFTATLAGAVLGFLFYNFNPASIFMGDTGSMFLGFVLATTSIDANTQASMAVSLFVPVIALGIPIADTLLAMARRAARGVPMFSADRGHIHHRLLDLGLSQRQTVLILYAVSVALGASALALSYVTPSVAVWFLAAVAGASYLGLRRLGFIDIEATETLLELRRRNTEIRHTIRKVGASLRHASSVEDVWAGIRMVADELGASAVALRLRGMPEEGDAALTCGFDEAALAMLRTRHPLFSDRAIDDFVEFGWGDGRKGIDRDTEIAIEMLCDQVSTALEQLQTSMRRERIRLVRLHG